MLFVFPGPRPSICIYRPQFVFINIVLQFYFTSPGTQNPISELEQPLGFLADIYCMHWTLAWKR